MTGKLRSKHRMGKWEITHLNLPLERVFCSMSRKQAWVFPRWNKWHGYGLTEELDDNVNVYFSILWDHIESHRNSHMLYHLSLSLSLSLPLPLVDIGNICSSCTNKTVITSHESTYIYYINQASIRGRWQPKCSELMIMTDNRGNIVFLTHKLHIKVTSYR